jgi:hypothetical protein
VLAVALGGVLGGLGVQPELALAVQVEPEDLAGVLREDRLLAGLLRDPQARGGERAEQFVHGLAQIARQALDRRRDGFPSSSPSGEA